MKKIILFICLFYTSLFAQSDTKNQSIELPDFVITGVQNSSLPEMDKNKPPLINSLSDEFFKPRYIPEQLSLTTASNPLRKDYNIFNQSSYVNGLLILNAGIHTMPNGHFYFNQSYSHYLLNTHIYGTNINNYVQNSSYNISGAEISNDFFISTQSSFLPGLKINLEGIFYRDSYHLFASADPTKKRENENIEGKISFTNNLSPNLKYGMGGSYKSLKFKNIDFGENILAGDAYLELYFGKFGISTSANYQYQDPKNSLSLAGSYEYYSGDFKINLKSFGALSISMGVNYSVQDTLELFSPVASFALRVDKNLSLFGEYSPHMTFYNISDLLAKNRYYIPGAQDNITTIYNSFTKFTLKYEYLRYIEFDVGAYFAKIDNQLFFTDVAQNGVFGFDNLDKVDNAAAFLHITIPDGQLGYLYTDLEYIYSKSDAGFRVPYLPAFSAEVTYGFKLGDVLDLSGSVKYFGNSYSDILNTVQLDSFIDLSFILKYEFLSNIKLTGEINNVLNKNNEFYKGYPNKPLDILGGIEYRW